MGGHSPACGIIFPEEELSVGAEAENLGRGKKGKFAVRRARREQNSGAQAGEEPVLPCSRGMGFHTWRPWARTTGKEYRERDLKIHVSASRVRPVFSDTERPFPNPNQPMVLRERGDPGVLLPLGPSSHLLVGRESALGRFSWRMERELSAVVLCAADNSRSWAVELAFGSS